jgi:hypothetical protein
MLERKHLQKFTKIYKNLQKFTKIYKNFTKAANK